MIQTRFRFLYVKPRTARIEDADAIERRDAELILPVHGLRGRPYGDAERRRWRRALVGPDVVQNILHRADPRRAF